MIDKNRSREHAVTLTAIEDELANGLTHGFGLVMALVGLAILMMLAVTRGDAWQIAGCTVYGISLVVLYAASTLYHAAREPKLKEVLRTVDHVAIFLLIAGTYTPFTLVNLRGNWGLLLFVVVWSVAILGIAAKIAWGDRWQWISLLAYIGLGWCGVVALKPVLATFPPMAVALLVAGGLAYTVGTIFFALDRIRYFHAVWHVFVLMGSLCHFLAVVYYVVPAATLVVGSH